MSFQLGSRSLAELRGVHPRLVQCVHLAIQYTTVDFGVHDGLRTKAEQAEYVRSGASTTMNSKHLVQPDGYGHAVDLVPYINGKLRWEWNPIYEIACAMHRAATELQLGLRWGGVWDRSFPEHFNGRPLGMEKEVMAYAQRRRALGRKAFLDGPHYEMA